MLARAAQLRSADAVRARHGGPGRAADQRPARRPGARAGRRHDRGVRRRGVRGVDHAAEALRLLRRGRVRGCCGSPRAAGAAADPRRGVRVVDNPCLSGGTLEIFLEPVLPPALVLVLGDGAGGPGAGAGRRRAGPRRARCRRPGARRCPPTPPRSSSPRTGATRRRCWPRRCARRRAVRGAGGEPARGPRVLAELAARGVDATPLGSAPRPGSTSARARRPRSPCRSTPSSRLGTGVAPAVEFAGTAARDADESDPVCGMAVAARPGDAVRASTTAAPSGSAVRGAATPSSPIRAVRPVTARCPATSTRCGPASTRRGYLADDALATALFLAVRMGQPILLEGEPGVGKTQAAKALARAARHPAAAPAVLRGPHRDRGALRVELPAQLLSIRLAESRGEQLRRRRPVHPRAPARPAVAGRHRPPRARGRPCC